MHANFSKAPYFTCPSSPSHLHPSIKASPSQTKTIQTLPIPPSTMESVGSNNPSSSYPHTHQTTNPRISRALHHRILLLHRSGHIFHILGSTSNVYTVTLSQSPTCSCPDPSIPCKHILFTLLRVFRLPISHPSLLRRSIRPSILSRILSSATNPNTLATPRLINRFHQLFFSATVERFRELGVCPVCLEEMEGEVGGRVVRCGVCGNGLHEECWGRWKRIRGRGAKCVICRARWRERREVERYLNLAGVVGEEEVVAEVDGRSRRRRVCGDGDAG